MGMNPHRGTLVKSCHMGANMGFNPMPRQARIDAPRMLYHIAIRGIERKAIFESINSLLLWLNIWTLMLIL